MKKLFSFHLSSNIEYNVFKKHALKIRFRTLQFVADSQKDSPTITGGKNRYSVGDKVDIKCTSSKSQPAAELHWYINNKEVIKLKHLCFHLSKI